MTDGRRLETLTRAEALRLLGSVPMGRVVFTHQALPAIRPINHLLDGDEIVIRTGGGSALARSVTARGDQVVAYEADIIDPCRQLGWSVIVVGRASRVCDEQAAARYRHRLQPWVAGTFDEIMKIQVEIVDGFRLVDGCTLEACATPATEPTAPATDG
jgi:Pyridoxamine 5'-phosphate oxidase